MKLTRDRQAVEELVRSLDWLYTTVTRYDEHSELRPLLKLELSHALDRALETLQEHKQTYTDRE